MGRALWAICSWVRRAAREGAAVVEELLSLEVDGFMSTAAGGETVVAGVGFILVGTWAGRNGVVEGAELENAGG